jgi:ribosomal protein S2
LLERSWPDNEIKGIFKRYRSFGFLKTPPRLIISFLPLNNNLFIKEITLLNIPFISLSGQDLSNKNQSSVDYPVILNNKNILLNNLLLRLLIIEAEKGKNVLLNKYKLKKLFYQEKYNFIRKVEKIL